MPNYDLILRSPTQLELAYVAGIIDGEGCITVNKCGKKGPNQWTIALIVGMIDREPLDMLASFYGGEVQKRFMTRYKRTGYIFYWRKYGIKAKDVLQGIYPFLRVKKKLAELALVFIETVRPKGCAKGMNAGPLKLSNEILEKRKQISCEMMSVLHPNMVQSVA